MWGQRCNGDNYIHSGLDGTCLTVEDSTHSQIYVRQCLWSGDNPQQSWSFHEGSGRLKNRRSGLCIASGEDDKVTLGECKEAEGSHTKWELSGLADPLRAA